MIRVVEVNSVLEVIMEVEVIMVVGVIRVVEVIKVVEVIMVVGVVRVTRHKSQVPITIDVFFQLFTFEPPLHLCCLL